MPNVSFFPFCIIHKTSSKHYKKVHTHRGCEIFFVQLVSIQFDKGNVHTLNLLGMLVHT